MTDMLTVFDAATQALAKAQTVDEVKDIINKAATIRDYEKRTREELSKTNYWAELNLRAQRRMGEILAEMEKNKGAQGTGSNQYEVRSCDVTAPPTYADLGVTKQQASRWQMIAKVPEEQFDAHIEEVKAKNELLTTTGVLRVAKGIVREQEQALTPTPATGAFAVVYADPPWRYDFSETDNREIENQYPTATVEEIIGHKPATGSNCVLFMWATAPKLIEALTVMDGWGFTYKTCAVWDKEKIGMGYWFRGQHELLLVGTRGDVHPPTPDKRVSSVFREKRQEHSQKPLCVYEWIEGAFPGAVKLEMYCRTPRAGWQTWGNGL